MKSSKPSNGQNSHGHILVELSSPSDSAPMTPSTAALTDLDVSWELPPESAANSKSPTQSPKSTKKPASFQPMTSSLFGGAMMSSYSASSSLAADGATRKSAVFAEQPMPKAPLPKPPKAEKRKSAVAQFFSEIGTMATGAVKAYREDYETIPGSNCKYAENYYRKSPGRK